MFFRSKDFIICDFAFSNPSETRNVLILQCWFFYYFFYFICEHLFVLKDCSDDLDTGYVSEANRM